MGNAAQRHLLSEAEYLAAEEQSPIRHEYMAGEVYAIAGGSLRHNRIAGNTYVALSLGLRGTPCQAFVSDVKLHVAHDNAYYYPDVMAACNEASPLVGEEQIVASPLLVIEVLSPSTETIDRREKLAAYRRLPSVMEYVLISQDRQQVEIYRRQGDIGWLYLSFEAGESVEFASVALSLPIDELYAGTDVSG
jgi:Uma2 family endonuclease